MDISSISINKQNKSVAKQTFFSALASSIKGINTKNSALLEKDTVSFKGSAKKDLKTKYDECKAELDKTFAAYFEKLRQRSTTKEDDAAYRNIRKNYLQAEIAYNKSIGKPAKEQEAELADIEKRIELENSESFCNPENKTVIELMEYLEKYGSVLAYEDLKQIKDVLNKKKAAEVEKPDDKKLIPPKQNCTTAEKNALSYYLGYFSEINGPLLAGEIPAAIQNVVHSLDNLIAKNEGIEDDAVVYRSILTKGINTGGKDLKKEYTTVGNIVTYKPYMSTSLGSGGKFENFENFDYRYSQKYCGITLRIHLPKGTKGAMVSDDEFLLSRNSKLKITAYNEETQVVDCEYILE